MLNLQSGLLKNLSNNSKEIYVRDAQGNVIAVYEVNKRNNVDSLFSKEFYIYGSSRLGYLMDRKYIARKTYGKTFGGAIPALPVNPIISIPNPFILPGTTTITSHYFGNKRYEISDWLGNVRVVINDKKTPVNTGTTTVSYFPQVVSVSDYYSFGSQINERSYEPVKPMYRFGFNGKDQQNELYGVGNVYDFGDRMYDARLGRWWSVDKKFAKYPMLSPYVFAADNSILYIEIDGKEWVNPYRLEVKKLNELLINNPNDKEIQQKLKIAQQNEKLVNEYLSKLKENDISLYNYIDNLKIYDYNQNPINVKVYVYLSSKISGEHGETAKTEYIKSSDEPNATYNNKKIIAPLRAKKLNEVGFDVTIYGKTSYGDERLANEAGDIMYYMEFNEDAVREPSQNKYFEGHRDIDKYLNSGAGNYSNRVESMYRHRKKTGEGKDENNNPYPLRKEK